MIRDIPRFSEKGYDLLIIGGGINGAAIANVAAGRGLDVALIEKGDFASGTSSKSTKILHGGIRYLENFEFGLVREALKERFVQLINAAHLTRSLAFIIPVYKNDKRPLWMMKTGVVLYEFLAGKYSVGKHQNLTSEEVLKMEPHLKRDDLLGAVLYHDAQMDDARLCLENVLAAESKGAHMANYVEAVNLIKEKHIIQGVEAKDLITNKTFKIYAKKIVCAVGPWTNPFLKLDDPQAKKRIRTTKGIHIVYKGQLTTHAVVITTKGDNRIFFVIPWQGHSLIGTTDTNFIKSPDTVEASQADIDYLFKEARRVFPDVDFNEKNIITTFAGLRPLVRKGGSPSKVSRKHVIEETDSGLIYVIGGKYTTYRTIAVECVGKILNKRIDISTLKYPLYGSGKLELNAKQVQKKFGVDKNLFDYLKNKYGKRCIDVLELTQKEPQLKKPICTCSPAIAAEVVYAITVEMAMKDEDIVDRRLSLNYLPCTSRRCCEVIKKILSQYGV